MTDQYYEKRDIIRINIDCEIAYKSLDEDAMMKYELAGKAKIRT